MIVHDSCLKFFQKTRFFSVANKALAHPTVRGPPPLNVVRARKWKKLRVAAERVGRVGRVGLGRTGSDWVGRVGRVGLGRTGSDWVGLGRTGSDWVGLGRTGSDWVGLGRTGSDWVGLGRTGSGRVGQGRTGSGRVGQICSASGRDGFRYGHPGCLYLIQSANFRGGSRTFVAKHPLVGASGGQGVSSQN
jgi:hypothetical protein